MESQAAIEKVAEGIADTLSSSKDGEFGMSAIESAYLSGSLDALKGVLNGFESVNMNLS